MRTLAAVFLVFALTLGMAAQSAPLPEKPQPQSAVLKPKKKQRIFGVVPVFDVVYARDPYTPLTPRQKFNLFADTTFDRVTFISAAFDAGINQATDTPAEYGQGAQGFGKRYGAALADAATSNLLGKFVFPVVFRQDPRYFSLNEGSAMRRSGYAMSRIFVTRADNGRNQFNASQILSAFTSAAVTNAWLPERKRGAELTAVRGASRLGVSMGFNLLKEFWPELSRKVRLTRGRSPSP